MCLLIKGKSSEIRSTYLETKGLLLDVFESNRDGLGVMYAKGGKLHVAKYLPKTEDDVVKAIMALPQSDVEVSLHFRMRTHGDVNTDNCHPYKVNKDSWLMHNGILQTGNAADKSKSDTWHFVKDYLAGLGNDALHDKGFVKMVERFIGNNRFSIVSRDGRMSLFNEDQGVHHEGLWFSNTYAWNPELLIPGCEVAPLYNYRFASSLSRNGAKTQVGFVQDDTEDDGDYYEVVMEIVAQALLDYDSAALADAIDTFGIEDVYDTVESWGPITEYRTYVESEHVEKTVRCVKAWTTGDVEMLAVYTPQVVAESLVLYCDWTKASEFDYDERAPWSYDEVGDDAYGWSDRSVGVQ